MSSGQKVACYHLGEEFDWWRCNVEGWVGRPPSPFPASFEHAHLYRESSADQRACVAGPPPCCPSGCCGAECKCEGCDGQALDEASRRLYWPLCRGPELPPMIDTTDLGDGNLGGLNGTGKKSPRRPHKRPPWCPAKLPNKWGVAGHPPPYTNYCKETLFNTRTANPQKVVIKTTF